MYIGLTFTLDSNTSLYIYDNSKLETPYPVSINKMELIVSSSLDTTKTYTFDCTDYILNHRESTEILKLLPSDLGMTTTYFPDGVYTFKYTLNNYTQVTKKILIFETVRLKLIDLNTSLNYGVEVSENSWEFTGDYSDSDLETTRLANALMDTLYTYANYAEISSDNETQILEVLVKLQRLLQIE